MTKYSDEPTLGASTYTLGHSDAEVQRLLLQARIYDDHTEHALRVAGLRPGMRVLDVGCGPGDVSIVASRLVGPTGTVLGVDAAADIIDFARIRAARLAATNIRFEQTSIEDIHMDEPVDAVIGRFILMHLPDPVASSHSLNPTFIRQAASPPCRCGGRSSRLSRRLSQAWDSTPRSDATCIYCFSAPG